MPEQVDTRKVFSLLEVTESIQQTISVRYGSSFWVRAEMNKLNHYPHSGHCYPELIDKRFGRIVAQIRGTVWKEDFQRINSLFISILNEPLRDGINILFLARITYDPVYGLSLRISDIDPSYTLGELEREKRESVNALIREGVFHLNKQLPTPFLPKRIAVISVETSKGYADFLKIISENPWGYQFFLMLFPALLQGEKVGASIGFQLDRIRQVKHHFDMVAIVRGGGGDAGLSGYNHSELAKKIAIFPLPVITGIGHATNETVVEMVAHRNCITPTEVADFLLQQFHNVAVPLKDAIRSISENGHHLLVMENHKYLQLTNRLCKSTNGLLGFSKHHFSSFVQRLSGFTRLYLRSHLEESVRKSGIISRASSGFMLGCKKETDFFITRIKVAMTGKFSVEYSQIENLRRQVSMLDPKNVLSRGYSITLLNGKAVRSYTEVSKNDSLKTVIFDGEIRSIVTNTQSSQPNEQ